MDNFNMNLFKYFYFVAFYKGFTNASKNLNLAQSNLSYNVKILEQQLGKSLINRSSRNFELSEDGNSLYETLKSVFGILESNISVPTFSSEYDELTIGIRHFLSDYILMKAINEFVSQFPNVHLNIKLYSKLDVDKYNEEYDIVIDYDDYTSLIKNSIQEVLHESKNIFVCGQGLYEQYKNASSIKDLDESKFISLNPCRKKGKFQKFCFENTISFVDIVSITDSILYKQLIMDNIGIAFVNEDSVREEMKLDLIKQINIKEEIFSDIVMLVHKNNKNIKNIERFKDVLQNQYNEGGMK